MKILDKDQIRAVEEYTLEKSGITRAKLIDQAASAAWDAMQQELYGAGPVFVLCGPGYNGADGLVLAAKLLDAGKTPRIFILAAATYPAEFNALVGQLFDRGVEMVWMRGQTDIPEFQSFDYVIDALYGTGVTRPLAGLAVTLIERLNEAECYVISVDLPSGVPANGRWDGTWPIVEAQTTYVLGVVKPCLILPDTGGFAGDWVVIDIGLNEDNVDMTEMPMLWLEDEEMAMIMPQERPRFAHKGNYGHVLLMGGKLGMCGGMVLAAQAALRSGAGLVSVAVPKSGLVPLQVAAPEAIVLPDPSEDFITVLPKTNGFEAIGIGPGLGTDDASAQVLLALLKAKPGKLVLDADAINILAKNKPWHKLLPIGTILTPHVGEFDRLCGHSATGAERLDKAKAFAAKHQCVIVLKGAYTATINPDGMVLINHTGNPGMASAGMGDALTGLITGMLGYFEPIQAACVAVYIHGMAGDLAEGRLGQTAMTAGAVVKHIGRAFRRLELIASMPDVTDPDYMPF